MINRLATWAVKVTVPAADGQSAQVTALATAVGTSLTGWFGKVVAILYDVLQAAVTVIWCIWMVKLFVDVVIIIRRSCRGMRRPGWLAWRCSIPAR